MAALCTLTIGGGCTHDLDDLPIDDEIATATAAIIVTNGSSINGPRLNGEGAPGSEVDGRTMTGNGASGSASSGIKVQGGELTTLRVSNGVVLSGAALVGATFATQTPGGSRIALRIDAYAASPSEHHAGSTVHHDPDPSGLRGC